MDNLQNGIAAFRAGKRDEARKHFIAAMRENPKNENVWGWLYQVSNNDKEKMECLSKMLAINPQNERARQMLNQMQTPPSTTAQPAQTKKADSNQQINALIGIGSVVFLCVLCVFIFSITSQPESKSDYKTTAYYVCRFAIENMLKAPSTAEFPTRSNANIKDIGNNTLEIRSYVDAQNSFGAVIRTYWYCKIQYTGTTEEHIEQTQYYKLIEVNTIE